MRDTGCCIIKLRSFSLSINVNGWCCGGEAFGANSIWLFRHTFCQTVYLVCLFLGTFFPLSTCQEPSEDGIFALLLLKQIKTNMCITENPIMMHNGKLLLRKCLSGNFCEIGLVKLLLDAVHEFYCTKYHTD